MFQEITICRSREITCEGYACDNRGACGKCHSIDMIRFVARVLEADLQYLVDFLLEVHIQKPVGFVEDQVLQILQAETLIQG